MSDRITLDCSTLTDEEIYALVQMAQLGLRSVYLSAFFEAMRCELLAVLADRMLTEAP
jgi:hypothetical protein